jgi:ParB-like chromosome segregation protein Spo0J
MTLNIEMVPINSVRPATWRATHVLKPDMKVLSKSMVDFGWLGPIVVRRKDSTIIDGFHRWVIAQDAEFRKVHKGDLIPVMFVEVDEVDARLMHVRLNRGRGGVVARFLALLLQDVFASRKYSNLEIRRMLGMSNEEIALLEEGSLLKHRKIDEYEYSKAWVPVEVPVAAKQQEMVIERPPNPDR